MFPAFFDDLCICDLRITGCVDFVDWEMGDYAPAPIDLALFICGEKNVFILF